MIYIKDLNKVKKILKKMSLINVFKLMVLLNVKKKQKNLNINPIEKICNSINFNTTQRSEFV